MFIVSAGPLPAPLSAPGLFLTHLHMGTRQLLEHRNSMPKALKGIVFPCVYALVRSRRTCTSGYRLLVVVILGRAGQGRGREGRSKRKGRKVQRIMVVGESRFSLTAIW